MVARAFRGLRIVNREARDHQLVDLRSPDKKVEKNLFANLKLKELTVDCVALAWCGAFFESGKFLPNLVDFALDPFSGHDCSYSGNCHVAPPHEKVAPV